MILYAQTDSFLKWTLMFLILIGRSEVIFYQTEKKGQIDFWNIKDIGLKKNS